MSRILNCIGDVVVRRPIRAQTCLLMMSSVTTLGLLVASAAIAQEVLTEAPEERASHHQELAERPTSENQLAEQPPVEQELDISIAKESLRLTPLFRVGGNTESGGIPASLTAFDGFFPLRQSPGDNVTFMNTRLNFDFEEDNSLGGTLLFGHRSYSSDRERVLGGYLSYDVRDTGEAVFPQVGLGFERLSERWDIRANGYIPVGDTRQRVDRDVFSASQSTSTLGDMAFNGNQLSSTLTTTTTDVFRQVDKFEAALGGFDVEAGTRLARWNEHGELRLYGGVYYLGGHDVSAVGGRGRIEIAPVESVRLMAGVQGDPVFDVRGFFGVSFLFPTPEPLRKDVDPDEREAAIAALGETVTRLADPVARNFNVVVDEQQEVEARTSTTVTTEEVPLVNPATGAAWRFTHVALGGSSDGTFEDPFGSLQEGLDAAVGDGNDVVYVALADDTQLDPFTIPDNVRVLSTGPEQVLEGTMAGTSIASVVLPGSDDGNFPDVTDSVTVGSNTKLSGFDIAGVTDSAVIGPDGLTGMVEISDNTLTSEVDDGIEIGEIAGDLDLLMARNEITNVADSGIDFDDISGGTSQIRIQDTTIQTAEDDGIDLDDVTGTAVVDVEITDTTIATVDQGIEIDGFLGDSQVTVAIDSADISNFVDEGIFVSEIGENADAEISIANSTISGAGTGILFETIGGSAGASIAIENSTVSDNGGFGVEFSAIQDDAEVDAAFTDNEIARNGSDGVQFAEVNDNAVLEAQFIGNNISENAGNGVFFNRGGDSAIAALFENNLLEQNTGAGLQDASLGTGTLELTFINNTVSDNSNFGLIIQPNGNTTLSIIDNTISNNNIFGLFLLNFAGADVCLDLNGNTADNHAVGDYVLFPGNFEVVDLDNVTVNNSGTFFPVDPATSGLTDVASCAP